MKLLRDKVKRDTYMCSKLCNMIKRGDLRDNHPQQRKSGLWDNETRDNFVVSVIKNEDFDPLKICEQLTDRGVILWLIDGLQRSTTIENYKAGKFALGKNIDPYIVEYQELIMDESGKIVTDEDGEKLYKTISYDLRGKSYVELPEKLKEDFNNCPVMIVKHLDCDDKEVSRHMVRYNSGSKMVPAQKIATYMYNNAKYVKSLSNHAFFSDCANFSMAAEKNGTVNKVVSESIMLLNFFDSWKTNAKKVGKYLNDNATKEMFEKFEGYLDRLLQVVTPETGKLFSPKNAFMWFKLFDIFNSYGLRDEEFASFLFHFDELKNIEVEVAHNYKLYDGESTNVISFDTLDKSRSTKDKGIVSDKLHILETIMTEFLLINKEESLSEENDFTESEKQHVNEESETSVIDFVRENIKPDVTEKDIEDYSSTLECYNINKDSPLLEQQNKPSLIGIIAYSFEKDLFLDNWIVDFFNKHDTYISNQMENYLYMKRCLDEAQVA